MIQERYIYVFGGWDTPVCYNDMYMLDLGEARRISTYRVMTRAELKMLRVFLWFYFRSNGVFGCESVRESSITSEVRSQKSH